MSEVSITLHFKDAAEAAGFLGAFGKLYAEVAPAPKTETAGAMQTAPVAATPSPAPVAAAPSTAAIVLPVTPTAVGATPATPAAPTVDLRTQVTEAMNSFLGRPGKDAAAARGVIQQYGGAGRLRDVPDANLPNLLAAFQAA